MRHATWQSPYNMPCYMPRATWHRENDFGDLYLETNVIIPESLSKEQKELLQKFKSLEDTDNNTEIKNFIKKAKSFWNQ